MSATPYIEGLVAGLAVRGAAPALRHRGRDVAAEVLAASVFRHARALAGLGIGPGRLVAMCG